MEKAPWETPLREYLGEAKISPQSSLTPGAIANIEHHMDAYIGKTDGFTIVEVPEHHDLRFYIRSSFSGYAAEKETGKVIGAMTPSLPYVRPAYRGRGIAAELNYQIDLLGGRMMASSYTRQGFAARVRTHALHVERAVAAGKRVPDAILSTYKITNGKARLREPYGVDAHNAWVKGIADASDYEEFRLRTIGYDHAFRTVENEDDHPFIGLSPIYEKGRALAVILSETHGAKIRMTIQTVTETYGDRTLTRTNATCQAQIGDAVIDAEGVRPADVALKDLINRGEIDPTTSSVRRRIGEDMICDAPEVLIFEDRVAFEIAAQGALRGKISTAGEEAISHVRALPIYTEISAKAEEIRNQLSDTPSL